MLCLQRNLLRHPHRDTTVGMISICGRKGIQELKKSFCSFPQDLVVYCPHRTDRRESEVVFENEKSFRTVSVRFDVFEHAAAPGIRG